MLILLRAIIVLKKARRTQEGWLVSIPQVRFHPSFCSCTENTICHILCVFGRGVFLRCPHGLKPSGPKITTSQGDTTIKNPGRWMPIQFRYILLVPGRTPGLRHTPHQRHAPLDWLLHRSSQHCSTIHTENMANAMKRIEKESKPGGKPMHTKTENAAAQV